MFLSVGDKASWIGLSGKRITGKVVSVRPGVYVIERNGTLITRTRQELA